MLQRTAVTAPAAFPLRPLRVLIEDPLVLHADLACPGLAVEVTACSGPRDGEECPLVVAGTCPFAQCDIVVTALDGAWAPSVRAAWGERDVALVDARDLASTDPAARLAHHVGAAMQRIWKPLGAPEV